MVYNNEFKIDLYFQKNYGLPAKPKGIKWNKPKNIIILLIFWWLSLIFFLIKQSKVNKEISQWEEAYQYRLNNWYKEFDKFYAKAEAAMDLKNKGMAKLGIVEEQLQEVKPFYIYGPKFDGYYRPISGGGYRSSRYEFTYIFFTEDQVLFYTRDLDLLQLDKKKESTQEYFYQDITSISTTTTSKEVKNTLEDNKSEEVETEAFVIIVPGDKVSLAYTGNETTNESVKGMKNLLRNKKMSK